MKKLKRYLSVFLAVTFALAAVLSGTMKPVEAAAVKSQTKRAIYVVFDNSGSMYADSDGENYAWSQATYAMEVFASMMNFENGDIMQVYPMHPVSTEGSGGAAVDTFTVESLADVQKIHNMYTPVAEGTPYNPVTVASQDLSNLIAGGTVDEGWLVVLTDGSFENPPAEGVQANLQAIASSDPSIFVQYLAIGEGADGSVAGNESAGFYAKKTVTSEDVVTALADISNHIFKRNEYAGDKSTLVFDIPLSKVIIFAQGDEVSVNELKGDNDTQVTKQQEDTVVSYSETGGTDVHATSFLYTRLPGGSAVPDTTLRGMVSVFGNSDEVIPAGTYSLDVSGAKDTHIYFEPAVSLGIALYKDGEQITGDTISSGDYELRVGFLNRQTGRMIEKSSLLGAPQYTLLVNGETYQLNSSDGSFASVPIKAEEGTLDIEAYVNYLNDYTDHVELTTYRVSNVEMNLSVPSDYTLKTLTDEGTQPVIAAITNNGQALTEEQWDAATLTTLTEDSEGNEVALNWIVKKGKDVSTWELYPTYNNDDMFDTASGDLTLVVQSQVDIDGVSYSPGAKANISLKDDITILDHIIRHWKLCFAFLLLFLLIIGYLPPIKKRFPKDMKRKPMILRKEGGLGGKDSIQPGKFNIIPITRILPYVPEQGTLKFCLNPVKTAKLKADGGRSMVIVNTSDFAGNDNIKFGTSSIAKDMKGKKKITPATEIRVINDNVTCICSPNRSTNGKSGAKSKRRK